MTTPFLPQYVTMTTELCGANQIHAPEGFVYASMDAFLKAHAQTFPVAAAQVLPGRFHAWPKQCFDNAYRVAARWPKRFHYAEGLSLGVIPVHHAWCVNQAGEVIDPTWAWRTEGNGVGTEYFGVVIPLPIVRQIRHKANLSMLDNWQQDWPLFREPWADIVRNGGPKSLKLGRQDRRRKTAMSSTLT